MRKSNTQPLKSAIEAYLKALKIDKKLKEVGLLKQWEDLMGTSIASATRNIFIRDGVLYVYLNSAIVRNELHYVRETIVRSMNKRAGENLIKEIVLK